MATQILGQPGGSSLFPGNSNLGMALANDMYSLHDIPKAELVAPQLIMLANVALTGDVGGNICDYQNGEEREMAELTTVGYGSFLDSREDLEGSVDLESDSDEFEYMEWEPSEVSKGEAQTVVTGAFESPSNCGPDHVPGEDLRNPESADDKCKGLKSKPFRCKPCQYEAESEKEFVHHIKVHSAKRFTVGEDVEKQAQIKESDFCTAEETDFSKGPIRCNRCGYNTNRYDHYLAHLKHHNKAGESERVYKCTTCTYTTVSEYHWKKHLRNHFPKKVYTCSQCSYFSDRKNNYIQHIRTHTGERPYQCSVCPYSSSQKTHLTRHMRTHSGEKPFKCEQCSYVAANQHEVTRHARQVHNGPKPLTCPHCDYKTADRSNFKKHVELHVNPRQFLCPVCDYAASKKCNLQYHIKSRHPDCSDITMDVSKVKLRTKKNETDFSDSAASEKSDREHTKLKGEAEEKKNEKTVKVEKRESSKDKVSTGPFMGQVKTKRHKVAPENKNVMDMKTEKRLDKSSKTKGVKRKAEAEFATVKQDLINHTYGTKKKMKLECKTRASQKIQKKHIKCKTSKKQKSCLKKGKKKKVLRNKYKKKIKKLVAQGKRQKKLIPRKTMVVKDVSRIADPSDQQKALESSDVFPVLVDCASHVANTDKSKKNELPTQSPAEKVVELGVEAKELLVEVEESRETTNQTKTEKQPENEVTTSCTKALSSALPSKQILKVLADDVMDDRHPADPGDTHDEHPVDLVDMHYKHPVNSVNTHDEHPADPVDMCFEHPANPIDMRYKHPANPVDKREELPVDPVDAHNELPADLVDTLDEHPADPADLLDKNLVNPIDTLNEHVANPVDTLDKHSADPVDMRDGRQADPADMPDRCLEGLTESNEDHQENTVHKTCEILQVTNSDLIDQANTDIPNKEKTQGHCEKKSKEAVFVLDKDNTAVVESMEMDEDEGIHSHDGSDISDNISEISDDSGLNGARSIPKAMGSKAVVSESAKSKVTVEKFVCIFCDRTFRKEGEYSKHLNRHLVNVYYLEKAAKGQE
ncbi:RE1-silencing transcription factor isoform X2 [Rhinatrema bivittatum]|nr:RE1-silencing transcription factor isoform X2 [Rhinatrema bivittatum]